MAALKKVMDTLSSKGIDFSQEGLEVISTFMNGIRHAFIYGPSVEDNRNGLIAAKSAGMYCIVTVSFYSSAEDFKEADLVVSSLGEPEISVLVLKPNYRIQQDIEFITVDILENIMKKEGADI